MAYNEMFALVFVAPYLASEKEIPPETIQEMMRRSLYFVKWFFSLTNLNTKRGKKANKKNIVKYYKWYTEEKEKLYPTSFKRSILWENHMRALVITELLVVLFVHTLKSLGYMN